MLTLVLNLLIAGWLFLSAFVLGHTEASAWNATVVAFLVAAAALFAFTMPGRPGIRWIIAALAIWLFAATMFVPHLTGGAILNEVIVAMALALGTFRPPARAGKLSGKLSGAHG
jgi:hypothetical protein